MGASGWFYFVPFQKDIEAALRTLQQEIFELGKYYNIPNHEWREMSEEEMLASLESEDDDEIREILLEEWRQVKNLPYPTTIEGLLEWNRESGTHSIIDMNQGVSHLPEFGTVSPLKSEELKQIFGSEMPNHEAVLKWVEIAGYHKMRQIWQGLYVIVYADENPSEICFAGFSGD